MSDLSGPSGKAAAHSGTNNHEAAADEPDIVKTDGRRIVTLDDTGTLRVIDAGTRHQLGDPLPLGILDGTLFLYADSALVLATEESTVTAVLVSLTDSAAPKVTSRFSSTGELVDARLTDGVARMVVKTGPRSGYLMPIQRDRLKAPPTGSEAIATAPLETWLPSWSVTTGTTKSSGRVDCSRVSRPTDYSGTSVLTIFTFDLTEPTLKSADPISVVADGDIVYATATSLYIANDQRWRFRSTPTAPTASAPAPPITSSPAPLTASPPAPPAASRLTPPASNSAAPSVLSSPSAPSVLSYPSASAPASAPASASTSASTSASASVIGEDRPVPARKTDIFRFTTTNRAAPVFAGAGSVPGFLLNQYALSEWDGHLRVATTSDPSVDDAGSTGGGASAVRILAPRGDQLVETGVVEGLGRGEQIYSVRFVGSRGYVVTFRQTDPLYSLDLSDPAAPRVTGELKITGYSSHLQPAGDGRLIGIGQEADATGQVSGTQVSLFDISAAAPQRLARLQLPAAQSEAEWDPHALLWWPQNSLLVVPLTAAWNSSTFDGGTGGVALKVSDAGITELADVGRPGMRRALVVNNTLWTVTDDGLEARELSALGEASWLPYR